MILTFAIAAVSKQNVGDSKSRDINFPRVTAMAGHRFAGTTSIIPVLVIESLILPVLAVKQEHQNVPITPSNGSGEQADNSVVRGQTTIGFVMASVESHIHNTTSKCHLYRQNENCARSPTIS
jgi:hypothetical protein